MLKIKAKQGQSIEAFARTAMMMMLSNQTDIEAVYQDVTVTVTQEDTLSNTVARIKEGLALHEQAVRLIDTDEFRSQFRQAYDIHKQMCGCGSCMCQEEFYARFTEAYLHTNGLSLSAENIEGNDSEEMNEDADCGLYVEDEEDEFFEEEIDEEELPEREPVLMGVGGYIAGLTPDQEAEMMVLYQQVMQKHMSGQMSGQEAYKAFTAEVRKKYPNAAVMSAEMYR